MSKRRHLPHIPKGRYFGGRAPKIVIVIAPGKRNKKGMTYNDINELVPERLGNMIVEVRGEW